MANDRGRVQPLALPRGDAPIFDRATMIAEDAGYCAEQRELSGSCALPVPSAP